MKQRDTNSIRYPKETDDKIEKLAKSLERSKRSFSVRWWITFTGAKKILQILEMSY